MSSPASPPWWCRKDSRTTRFNRLRAVARRQCFLEIASPSLAYSLPLSLDSTVKKLSRLFLPFPNTRPNEAESDSRLVLLKRKLGRPSPVADAAFLCFVTSPRIGLAILRRQLRAPLGAPALQDLLAGFGRHAGTEAVIAGALDSAGLECAFHRRLPLWSRALCARPKMKAGKGTRGRYRCQQNGRGPPLAARDNSPLHAAAHFSGVRLLDVIDCPVFEDIRPSLLLRSMGRPRAG